MRRLVRSGPSRFLFSLFLAAGIVFALFKLTRVSPRVILDTLGSISPSFLLFGFALHLSAYALRALRFRILLHSKGLSFGALFPIVTVHNFLNHVLPMRAGELSYIYLVRERYGVPVGEGLGTLAIARMMDLMSFLVYFPLAVVLLSLRGYALSPPVWKALTASLPVLLVLAGSLLFFSLKGRMLYELLARWTKRRGLHQRSWVAASLGKLERTVESFEHLRSSSVYLRAFFLSLCILGVVYLVGYVLLAGMGYSMSLPLVILCSTLAYLGFLFPIYSFAGFGMLEAGWTAGCIMAGFSKEMGVASGFSFHIIVLVYVTLLGLWGMALMRMRKRTGARRFGTGMRRQHPEHNDEARSIDQDTLK